MSTRVLAATVAGACALVMHALGTHVEVARCLSAAALVVLSTVLFRHSIRSGLALGVVGLSCIYAFLGWAGSATFPLVLIWVVVAGAYFAPIAAITTVALSVATEVISFASGRHELTLLFGHLGWIAVFVVLAPLLLRAERHSLKKEHKRKLNEALLNLETDARDFRLFEPGSTYEISIAENADHNDESRRRRRIGSVQAIRNAHEDALELARLTVRADLISYFHYDAPNDQLVVKSHAPRTPESALFTHHATEGALGAVVKTKGLIRLVPRAAGHLIGHPLFKDARAFIGVPLTENGELTGVLAAIRSQDQPFETNDETLMLAFARQMLRTIEMERLVLGMERAHLEQESFYAAFSLLNTAHTVEDVADRLLDAIARIKTVSLASVTIFDAQNDQHTILRARGAEQLEGVQYAGREGGLVAMAVKTGHPLPAGAGSRTQIFGDGPSVSGPAKVFPLVHRLAPLGTLVIGEELSVEDARMIEIVARHAAASLANAQMYEAMAKMATTDALTGLVNRRRFMRLADDAIARAERFSRKISFLMIDIDHFKKVNDTFGHAVGDTVLRRVASLLVAEARRTDVVARYGGEEFMVMLDETDVRGGVHVAQRMRERIAKEATKGEFGTISVTISVGLATLPDHATTAADILNCADRALYEAKGAGRNQVKVYRGARCMPPSDPAIAVSEERART